jgi:hypothetical protein
VTEHAHRSLNQFQRRRCGWALLHFHGLEQGLHGLAELGDTVQSDDGQSSLHLMQMGAAELDLGQITGAVGSTRRELSQRFVGTLQREIDLALDPGQRADIEVRCGIHRGQSLQSSLVALVIRTL